MLSIVGFDSQQKDFAGPVSGLRSLIDLFCYRCLIPSAVGSGSCRQMVESELGAEIVSFKFCRVLFSNVLQLSKFLAHPVHMFFTRYMKTFKR